MTIKDIAELAGVSVSTVSRVLNNRPDVDEKTRAHILDIVSKTRYEPNTTAKRLKMKESDEIAVIIRGAQNIFLFSIVELLQLHIEKHGFHFLLHYIDERDDEFNAARAIREEKKVRGVIFLGGSALGRERELESIGIPCVFSTQSARGARASNVSSVSVDDRAAGYKAGEYLTDCGHRSIAVVGGIIENQSAIKLRFEGFCDALRERGVKFDSSLYLTASFSPQSAYTAVKQALEEGKKFTAMFAMSDTMAMGAARAVDEFGLNIPNDISIMGYDGIQIAEFFNPPITTIRQPTNEIAQKSVDLLMSGILKRTPPENITVDFEFIERSSIKRLDSERETDVSI